MVSSAHRLLLLLLAGTRPLVSAADASLLVQHLESVPGAALHVYGLRDDRGMGMDCLKLFQPGDNEDGSVLGVYHHRKDGAFSVHLARTTNLVDWTHVTTLDSHASQATIRACAMGDYLLAYEKDAPNSCWIRIRHYENLSDLCAGKHAREFDIARTLAPTAEGTPSFESVTMEEKGVDTSEMRLRFHYFRNGDVDQLARGSLTGFKSWNAEPSEAINARLKTGGWHGNLGDRDRFTWQGNVYYLQEVQRVRGDWSSWRVCLCRKDGMPIHTLAVKTHQGSVAFANPNATWITDSKNGRRLVVTLFLPSEGNPPEEAGTVLYVIDPNTANEVPKATDGSAP